MYGTQEEITIEVTDLLGIDTKQQVIERSLDMEVHWDEESGLWEFNDETEEEELNFDPDEPHLVISNKYYDLDPLSEN